MQTKHTKNSLDSTRVIVVGAGLAGLTAAYELAKDPGIDVLLLEARDRVGGRVLSRRINGHPIDLGGFLVFPWYRHYRGLCDELGLEDKLQRVPSVEVYFDLGDRKPINQRQLELDVSQLIPAAAKSIASALAAGSLDNPRLDHYRGRTIEACIDGWVDDDAESKKYKQLVDTLCQGYCYPPIAQYKAAFAMPIYPRTVLLGNAKKSDLFRHGSRTLPEALRAAFIDSGGQLTLGCEVTGFDGECLETSTGEYSADFFVFAQNADHKLMQDLVPRARRPLGYTRFATAVVKLNQKYQQGVKEWGAIFFSAQDTPHPQVLSMIDLQRLYASESLGQHYTVNIRLDKKQAIGEAEIIQAVNDVCLEGCDVVEVLDYELWLQTMPISEEHYVETVRALQGVGGCYFAGDYLGCPSMEVAVATGIDAAKAIRKSDRDELL
ncbi:MAG: FAD-dependent oxidoreductase [Gammaproteobacteria bacterium]|nr:FAD-dependent oxidoreductase [Gammaproteobacteria bacterium]NNM11890.1 FAD-dependent oxidoreductase [Pseudomonadales bacterium]